MGLAVQLPDGGVLLAWLLIVVLTAWIIGSLIGLRDRGGPLSPFALFSVIFLIAFTLRGVALASGEPHHLKRAYDLTTPGFAEILAISLIGTLIGYMAVALGHKIGPSQAIAAKSIHGASERLFGSGTSFAFVVTLFALVGLAGVTLAFVRRGSGEFYPVALMNFGVIAAVLLAIRWFTNSSWRLPILVAWSALALVLAGYGLFTGAKVIFIQLLFPLAVGFHFYVRPLRWGHLALAITLFAVTFPFFYAVRNVGFTSRLPAELDVYYSLDRIAAPFLGREYGLDATMIAVSYIESGHEFYAGRTFETLPSFFVPRALWPEKPVSFGLVFNREVAVEGIFEPSTFLSPSVIGELYLNGGIIGIVLGCLVIGAVQRAVATTLLSADDPAPLALALYATLAIRMAQLVEGPLATHLEFALTDVATMVFAVIIASGVPPLVWSVRSWRASHSGPLQTQLELPETIDSADVQVADETAARSAIGD